MIQQTIDVLKKFEGFSSTAYWDVNAYRIGYGSDTITSVNGAVRKVKKGDTVTREQADLDLARRIPEFEKVIIKQVGADAWDKLPDQAKAALVSFAYNYGSIAKKSLREAITTGDLNKIADTLVQSTLNDNAKLSKGVRDALKARRQFEADLIRTAQPSVKMGGFDFKKLLGIALIAAAFTIFEKKLRK